MSAATTEQKRITETILPIEFIGWDTDEAGDITYYDVKFLDAFGKWHKNESAAILILKLTEGLLVEYSNHNNNPSKIKEHKIKIAVAE